MTSQQALELHCATTEAAWLRRLRNSLRGVHLQPVEGAEAHLHYDDTRGVMLASGSQGLQVLMLQPQMIEALGLPKPTDPKYPYK